MTGRDPDDLLAESAPIWKGIGFTGIGQDFTDEIKDAGPRCITFWQAR